MTGLSKNNNTKNKVTTKARTMDLTLRGREEKKLYQFAAFSPAVAHWELANNDDAAVGVTVKPYCWYRFFLTTVYTIMIIYVICVQ